MQRFATGGEWAGAPESVLSLRFHVSPPNLRERGKKTRRPITYAPWDFDAGSAISSGGANKSWTPKCIPAGCGEHDVMINVHLVWARARSIESGREMVNMEPTTGWLTQVIEPFCA